MDLSIVIVTTNAIRHIDGCLSSIYQTTPLPEIEVVVSDNGSTDGTVELVKEKYPQVLLVQNGRNLGFGPANNRGLSQSKGRYILFLNDDTIVRSGALSKMIEFMDANPDVGVLGAKLLNPDGTLQRSITRDPSIWMDMLRALLPRRLEINTPATRKLVQRYAHVFGTKQLGRFSDHNRTIDVDCVMGACLLTRRSILERVGSFDENIFFWCEENDLCYRIRQAKWRIVYYPDAEIVHFGGSTVGRPDNVVPKRVFVQRFKSNLYYYEKHTPKWNVVIFKVGIVFILLLRYLGLCVQLLFSRSDQKRLLLGQREISWTAIRVLLDTEFQKQNVYTEMKFKYLD